MADILDEERHAIENARDDALVVVTSGEQRMRMRRLMNGRCGSICFLTICWPHAKSAELQLRVGRGLRRFDELSERLRSEMMQQVVDRVSKGWSRSRLKMSSARKNVGGVERNDRKRDQGEDPGFEKFMDEYGDMFPDDPGDA